MIKLLVKAGVCLAIVATAYASAPFHAAWSIREAVRQSDTATLSARVDWPSVRETMHQSMLRGALDLPDPALIAAGVTAQPVPAAQGAWARFKTRLAHFAGRRMVDTLVETYITPQGLPRLYAFRRQKMQLRHAVAATDPPGPLARFSHVWSRIKRAQFHSLTQFEIDIEDRFDRGRLYQAVLKLRGDRWILTELRIFAATTMDAVASAR